MPVSSVAVKVVMVTVRDASSRRNNEVGDGRRGGVARKIRGRIQSYKSLKFTTLFTSV